MRVLFWIGVVWISYVYVGYPLVLAVLARVGRRIHPAIKDDFLPSVSVLISARNEEKDIGWKVTETLGWDYPMDRLELLVASDASEDRTDEVLQGVRDPRLKLVRMEHRSGKGVVLNRLAQLAQGELLFFTDANAHIPAHSLKRMARHFADGRVGCVTGDTHGVRDVKGVVGSGAKVYGGYESVIKRLESELGSVLVCDGAIFCIRRSLYTPLCPELANDLELPMRIGRAGYWVRHEPGAVVFEKDTSSAWESFKQRRRISSQGMLAMWRLRNTLVGLRGWQFISRKFLRWLSLVPLLVVLLTSISLAGRPFFLALLPVQVAFYLAALFGLVLILRGHDTSEVVSTPFYVVLGSLSTLVGVIDACAGKRFAVWEIPTLSRGGDKAPWQRVD
jgi:cellulose synthase/poly-beta-1,6-N-acetylglucosamine synthase-like glycosyltransferase